MTDASYHHGNLREALITAALDLIRREGTEAVSLRGLARDLGVSHAAPSRHFATRDMLFAAIADRGYRDLSEQVARARTATDDPVERLRHMARAFLAWAGANPALYAAMRNPEVARHADDVLRARMQGFAREQIAFVAEARAAGWRAGEAPEVTFLSIVAGLTGLGMILTDPFTAEIVRQGQAPDAVTDALIDRLLAP